MRTLATLLLCSALYAQDLGVKAPPQKGRIGGGRPGKNDYAFHWTPSSPEQGAP